MALATTNISVSLVKNTLGEGTTAVSALCTSSLINKWSRYKPVKGVWPNAEDGKFGLNLNDWSYIHPTGGATYPYRLGDFRGYEHTGIMPAIYSNQILNHVPATLDPSGTITTATFGFKANSTNATTRIKPIDLGLADYFIGIRYKSPVTGFWWYKTDALVSDLTETTGTPINIDVTVSINFTTGLGVFANAPTNETGTIQVELVICNTQCTAWTTTAPTTVIKLPSEVVMNEGTTVVNAFSFVVSGWLALSNETMYWSNSAVGVGNYQSSKVATSSPAWVIESKPSWLTSVVYRAGSITSAPFQTGDELRVYPTVANAGLTRYDYITIGSQSIHVEYQGGNPTYVYDYTGLVGSTNTIVLTPNAGSAYMSFKVVSGLGGSNVTVWYRLYNQTTSNYIGTDWQSSLTRDGQIVNATLTGFVAGDIDYGNAYSVHVTDIDPFI